MWLAGSVLKKQWQPEGPVSRALVYPEDTAATGAVGWEERPTQRARGRHGLPCKLRASTCAHAGTYASERKVVPAVTCAGIATQPGGEERHHQ